MRRRMKLGSNISRRRMRNERHPPIVVVVVVVKQTLRLHFLALSQRRERERGLFRREVFAARVPRGSFPSDAREKISRNILPTNPTRALMFHHNRAFSPLRGNDSARSRTQTRAHTSERFFSPASGSSQPIVLRRSARARARYQKGLMD